MNTGRVVAVFDFEPLSSYLADEPVAEPVPAQPPAEVEPIEVIPAEELEPAVA